MGHGNSTPHPSSESRTVIDLRDGVVPHAYYTDRLGVFNPLGEHELSGVTPEHIRPPSISPIQPDVVVDAANELQDPSFRALVDGTGALSLERIQKEGKLTKHVESFREDLRSLPPHQREILDEYLRANFGDSIFDTREDVSATKWLVDAATDEQLTSLIRRHQTKIESQRQSEAILTSIEVAREEYLVYQKRLFLDGYLSVHALKTAEKVRSANVYVGDIWDTLLHENEGYFIPGKSYVVVAPDLDEKGSLTPRAIRNLKHEFGHLDHDVVWPKWIDEAVTEHLASSQRSGEVDTVGPSKRKDQNENRTYLHERELLGVLLQEGTYVVDPKLVTRAHSSDGDSSVENLTFQATLNAAWSSTNIIEEVTSRLEAYKRALGQESERNREQGKPYLSPLNVDREATLRTIRDMKERGAELRDQRVRQLSAMAIAHADKTSVLV